MSNVNLMDVRTFVLIAQLGNFTKAAEAIGVSRSHVSRQVSHLESQMGVTLLQRTTRTLKLTDAGRRFYQSCEQSLFNIDQAVEAAVSDVETLKGEIRINSVGGYLGETIIADIATDFMLAHPEVNLTLDFSSHRVDLFEEEFDVAFRMGKLSDASFVARRLITLSMSTLVAPSYLAGKAPLTHPDQLHEHRCLAGSVDKWHYTHKTKHQRIQVQVNSTLKSKNGRVLVSSAVKGNGIIRVPSMYCRDEVAKGTLVEVFEDWALPEVELSMIYHKDRYQAKRLRAFIDFVKKAFDKNSL